MSPTILESGGAKTRSSLQRSMYSTSVSPSSSRRMLDPLTMEEDRRLVRLLPLELLSSDMGDMQEDLPDMEEIPLSEWLWWCRGLCCSPASPQPPASLAPAGGLTGLGPLSRLFFHQLEMDFSDLSLLRWSDCCLSGGWRPGVFWFSSLCLSSSLRLRGVLTVRLGSGALFSSILWKKLLRTSLLCTLLLFLAGLPSLLLSSWPALLSSFFCPLRLRLSSL